MSIELEAGQNNPLQLPAGGLNRLASAGTSFLRASIDCRPTTERRYHRTTAGMSATLRYIYGEVGGNLDGLDAANSLVICINDSVDLGVPVRRAIEESNHNLVGRLRFANAVDTALEEQKKTSEGLISLSVVEAYEHNIRLLGGNSGIETAQEAYAENALIATLTIASYNEDLLKGTGIDPNRKYVSKEELVEVLLPQSRPNQNRSKFDEVASMISLVKIADDHESSSDQVWGKNAQSSFSAEDLLGIAKPSLDRLHPLIPRVVSSLYSISYRLKARNFSLSVNSVGIENPRVLVEATLLKSILREVLANKKYEDFLLEPSPALKIK